MTAWLNNSHNKYCLVGDALRPFPLHTQTLHKTLNNLNERRKDWVWAIIHLIILMWGYKYQFLESAWCTSQYIEKVVNLILVKHGHLSVTLTAAYGVVQFRRSLLFWPLISSYSVTGLWCHCFFLLSASLSLLLASVLSLPRSFVRLGKVLENFISLDTTVHDKHGSVLVCIDVVSAREIKHDIKAG